MFIFKVINNDGKIKRIIVMNCNLSNKINVNIWRFDYVKEIWGISVQFLVNISVSIFKLSSIF